MTQRLASQNLAVSFGANKVLDGVDLSLQPGRITAIVGPNASGKSTLLRALARLQQPGAGTVTLNGTSIFRQPTRAVARQIAILPQAAQGPPGMRVGELVARGRTPHQTPLRQWSADDEAIVDRVLDQVGLCGLADRLVDELSGGQRQRAWIAMALAQDTGILLLDEPTTFLDLPHQLDILALVHTLSRQKGQTVAMVLHDINLAARFCDRIVAMRDRGIIRQGTPNEVVTEGNIAAIYGMRSVVITDPTHGTPHVIPK